MENRHRRSFGWLALALASQCLVLSWLLVSAGESLAAIILLGNSLIFAATWREATR